MGKLVDRVKIDPVFSELQELPDLFNVTGDTLLLKSSDRAREGRYFLLIGVTTSLVEKLLDCALINGNGFDLTGDNQL